MTAAIFGLLGVIVGGVLTIASDLLRERRSLHTQTQAGARLLSAELSVQQYILQTRADDNPSAPAGDDMPEIVAWPEYRDVMARALDQKAWQGVAGAYFNLVLWHFGVGPAASGTAQERRDQMRTLASEVETARRYLQDLWPSRRRKSLGKTHRSEAGSADPSRY
jgi:hypothetical protein